MNEKFLKEKKSQKILLSVMAALILILAVCAISTADTAIPENALTQCEPERIQDLDNGVQQIYFNIDQKNDGDSLVFFTLHQYVDVFADDIQSESDRWGVGAYYRICMVLCKTAERCKTDGNTSDTLLSGSSRSDERILYRIRT